MNTHVNFETAKLLKEKGFDKNTNTLYQLNGTIHIVIPNSDYPHLKVHRNKEIDSYTSGFLNWNGLNLDEDESIDLYSGFDERYDDAFSVCCSAPTIAEVVMWLYEKHGVWIVPSYALAENNVTKEWFWVAIKDGEEVAYKYGDCNSPTEAYETGIEHTLKHLI